jgi:hypothetical protein
MNFAKPVRFSRVIENTFGSGGFPRVDMGNNADIAGLF